MTTYKAKEVPRIEVWTQYEQPVSKQFKETCSNFESLTMRAQAAMSSEEREGLEHRLQNLRPTLTAHPDALLTRYRLMTMMVGAYATEMGRLIFSGTLDDEDRRQLEDFQQKQERTLAIFDRARRKGAKTNKENAQARKDQLRRAAEDLVKNPTTANYDVDWMCCFLKERCRSMRERDIRAAINAAKKAARRTVK